MTRIILPNARPCTTCEFEHEGIRYTASFGEIDGELREMFLDGPKTGSAASVVAREAAVILSLALQFGCPLPVIKSALPQLADGSPAGPVGKALSFVEILEVGSQ